MQVSIIVLTYHADPVKLRQTLAAAAAQKGVSTEIIICDDGSAQKDFSFLDAYMQSLQVEHYRLVENPVNRGTVQNCLSGVRAAIGEYVFLTSPGDLLYDAYVLRDFYRFAVEQEAGLCFGNSIYYCREGNTVRLTRPCSMPANPQIYAADPKIGKRSFFGGNWVIGAAYFRERKLAQKYLEEISVDCVYMEDTPTTAFALADGVCLRYFDRNMVWYEDGTGVSTGSDEKWRKLLMKDLQNAMRALKQKYPSDPWVDLACCNACITDRCRRIFIKLFRHPIRMLQCQTDRRRYRAVPVSCPRAHLDRLQKMLLSQQEE